MLIIIISNCWSHVTLIILTCDMMALCTCNLFQVMHARCGHKGAPNRTAFVDLNDVSRKLKPLSRHPVQFVSKNVLKCSVDTKKNSKTFLLTFT